MRFATLPPSQVILTTSRVNAEPMDGTVETRLWREEHDWLYALLKSAQNVSPTFRFPDLISACVSLACAHDEAAARLFAYLATELVLRPPHGVLRRESMWLPQYELLQTLQRSPANAHPHPRFQLDQFTTGCVALSRKADPTGADVLRQARINLAGRITQWRKSHSAS